jgi:hypothetical protein
MKRLTVYLRGGGNRVAPNVNDYDMPTTLNTLGNPNGVLVFETDPNRQTAIRCAAISHVDIEDMP